MFDTLVVFLKEFFPKVDFERNQQTTEALKCQGCNFVKPISVLAFLKPKASESRVHVSLNP